ncbi:unnamed protein product, partial [Rhizophagus irregularis]
MESLKSIRENLRVVKLTLNTTDQDPLVVRYPYLTLKLLFVAIYSRLVANIQPSEDSDEREISLSIRVKGKKAYDDWEIGEVLKEFLHQDGSSIGDIPTFKMDDLKNPDPEITQVELKLFVDELKKKKSCSEHCANTRAVETLTRK